MIQIQRASYYTACSFPLIPLEENTDLEHACGGAADECGRVDHAVPQHGQQQLVVGRVRSEHTHR